MNLTTSIAPTPSTSSSLSPSSRTTMLEIKSLPSQEDFNSEVCSLKKALIAQISVFEVFLKSENQQDMDPSWVSLVEKLREKEINIHGRNINEATPEIRERIAEIRKLMETLILKQHDCDSASIRRKFKIGKGNMQPSQVHDNDVDAAPF